MLTCIMMITLASCSSPAALSFLGEIQGSYQEMIVRIPQHLVLAQSWEDWAAVTVTAIGIIVAICTLLQIKQQTALNQKTLALQFRPKIILRTGDVVVGLPTASLKYEVANVGGTPAKVKFGLTRIYSEGGTEASQLLGNGKDFHLEPGESLCLSWALDQGVRGDIQNTIFHATNPHTMNSPEMVKVYLIGHIEYSDDLNVRRRSAFFRKYNPISKRFVREEDPDREYAD